ncbi:hypothetical protein DYB32_000066 [Aphanomyces invadans]|uniref:Uncharacterized protein n=1 Tax=Aphanomyces invadans TaxID=157072 RepID=A0A3R6ZBK8_9STRA|nr:hypothetical protein DYB32_000066 [Aphanomyces invadans]
MKRLEPQTFSQDTIKEMEHIITTDKQHKQAQRVTLIADITKLGDVEEARNKLRVVFIPDKPLPRVLRRSKLVGADKKVITSLVRPLSPSEDDAYSIATRSSTAGDASGCSLATTRATTKRSGKGKNTQDPTEETPAQQNNTKAREFRQDPLSCNDDEQVNALKAARTHLEDDLLKVTKKLFRKYERQVFPGIHSKAATYQTLHKKWSEPNLTDAAKYRAYMDGRFATSNNLEFFKKTADPRDNTNSFHRIHRQHTKYGDSLAFAKHSLRDKF